MSIKGIIFDLDGVLVFTDQYHFVAWKRIADALGCRFDKTINNRLRGVCRMDCLDIILEDYHGEPLSPEQKFELAEKKNGIYRELLSGMTPESVDPSVRQTLETLRDRGYRLAVGSSSKNAMTILECAQLTDYFDTVSDGNNIKRSKPDPEVFIKAALGLRLACAECAVVEDAFAGIEAACAAGMTSVGIGDAARCDHATHSITKITELTEIFKQQRE